jgi:hypothetical protein
VRLVDVGNTNRRRGVTVLVRRAAAAPGPKIRRYERPCAVRRSRPDATTSAVTKGGRLDPKTLGHNRIPLSPGGYIDGMTTDGTPGGGLTDDALQSEIELVGDLVAAASASAGPLAERDIDRVLGVPDRKADGAADEDDGTDPADEDDSDAGDAEAEG